MARMARKISTATGPGAAFYKRLKQMGCVLCDTCFAYMPKEHQHISALAADRHSSKYVLVGGYGNVKAVEADAEMAA